MLRLSGDIFFFLKRIIKGLSFSPFKNQVSNVLTLSNDRVWAAFEPWQY